MKKAFGIFLSLILILSSSARAELEVSPSQNGTSALDRLNGLSYSSALPELRTMLGPQGRDEIATLNAAYMKLKAQNPNPTVGQVIARATGQPRPSADLGDIIFCTTTLVGAATNVAIVAHLIKLKLDSIKARREYDKRVAEDAEEEAACNDKVSLVVDRASRSGSASRVAELRSTAQQ